MSSFSGSFATYAAKPDSGIQPVLEITLNDATWHSGTSLYLSGGVASARGNAYDVRVVNAGWGDINKSFDLLGSNLSRLETTVTVADTDGAVKAAIESGQQRGSVANIYWVIPGNSTDYALRFSGVLESWRYQIGQIDLTLRTQDAALRNYLPNWSVTNSEFPTAPAASLGLYFPLVYGVHDSSGLSGTGMVTCIPIRVDSADYWDYVACLGQAKEVVDVYVNGSVKTITTDYTISYSTTVAGKSYTVISFVAAKTADDLVTCDIKGYDVSGNTGSGTTAPTGSLITNPVEQIRHLLLNHAEDRYSTGAWETGTGSLIDSATWAEAAQWAERQGLQGSGYVGNTTERRQVADILNEWLDSYKCFRAYWTASGKLALRVLDLDFPGYRTASDPPLLRTSDEVDNTFDYTLDTTDLTDNFSAQFLYGQADGRYWSSLTVTDPDLGEGIGSDLTMPWSLSTAT